MNTPLTLQIGGIAVRILSHRDVWDFGLYEDRGWQASQASPTLVLTAHLGPLPRLTLDRPAFRSGGNWTLHIHDRKWVFVLKSPATGPDPYALAVINPDFNSGDIYVREPESVDSPGPEITRPNPLEYPLDELFMVHLLSRGRGHLFHACGVDYRGKGLLFAGVSGAGKSTIANLWKGVPGAAILSDDRVIVRKGDSRFWMYGTPWHGDAGVCSAGKVPLKKIFFLKHGDGNRITGINAADAAARAIVCSFPTYWHREGMGFGLDFCGALCLDVPCHELTFTPDPGTLKFLIDIL